MEKRIPEKPQSLNEILSEERLCEWLGLDLKANSKRGSKLAYCIRDGLRCVTIGGKRFFFEKNVIDYIFDKSQT
jgi:hypothetical protein